MHLFSTSQESFAVVSDDNRLKIYDVSAGSLQFDLKERDHLNYKYTCMAWGQRRALPKKTAKRSKTADQGMIALGTNTGVIVLWDLHKGEVVQRFSRETEKDGHSGEVQHLAFNSTATLLYSCSKDKHVLEWNVADGKILRKFRCGSDGANQLAVSLQDDLLATGGTTLRTFDLASGKKDRKFVAGISSSAINQLEFSKCKRFLFASTIGGRFVNMYDLQGEHDEPVLNFSLPSSASSFFAQTSSKKKSTQVLLGVVTITGDLFVWSVKYKGQVQPKPLAPMLESSLKEQDGKSKGKLANSVGILRAQLDVNTPEDIIVVRGSNLKPLFERVTVVNDSNKLVESLVFEPVSEHLLLDQAAKKAKTTEAQEDTKTHIPTLSERGGLDKSVAMKEAEEEEDDDVFMNGEDDEDEEESMTLADKIESLRGRIESDVAAELERVDQFESAGTRSADDKPDAASLASVLEQALQTKDNAMVEYVLRTRETKVINNTIKKVASVKVLQLLDILVIKLEKTPTRCSRLCPWIRSILLFHTAFLMTQPDLVQSLSALYQTLENRLKVHEQLQKLSGRLSLVIGQLQEATNTHNTMDQDSTDKQAAVVYREEEDEEEEPQANGLQADENEEDAPEVEDAEDDDDEEEEEDDDDDEETEEE